MAREALITVQQVADYLNCSVSSVRRFVMRQQIPHYRLGKLVRFRRSEIDSWLSLHREGDLPAGRPSDFNPDQLPLFGPELDPFVQD
tara:strand:- start:47 stop:307 length:261 start_codon:yes stop_codon:yes gene_type:complete